jgi:hypothetical protein
MDEMTKALIADGENLRQLTGQDHGPHFLCDTCGTEVSNEVCLRCGAAPCCPRCCVEATAELASHLKR